jgi:hypothetical protein
MFDGSQVLDNYAETLPCWYTGSTCDLRITFLGGSAPRKQLPPAVGVSTVDPSDMSATNTYRVGTIYRIAPLAFKSESAYTYSLVDAPDDFYINPTTGVVIATFDPGSVTVDRSIDGAGIGEPITVTLVVISDDDNLRAVVETFTMHVEASSTFVLARGERLLDDRYRNQYIADDSDEAIVLLVDAPFRVAARRVDPNKTALSGGGFEDITFVLKVYNTTTGAPINRELDQVSIKPNGELLGAFNVDEMGNYTVIITAIDGGGGQFRLEPLVLHVRQLDVKISDFGPNAKGCANNGVPIDDSGDPFDGKFTSCDCSGIALFVGENCDELCAEHEIKNAETGICSGKVSRNSEPHIMTVVAINFGLLLLCASVFVLCRKYQRHRRSMQPIDFDERNLKMLEDGAIEEGQFFRHRKPRELKRSDVMLLERVGGGAFGAVWNAVLDESAMTGDRRTRWLPKHCLTQAPL